ncbi:uncharacterized protein LOC122242264 [Penaeus japonicus]|uniref:uncharacterized protein LOC122242264 n=1 Tax=Penaeus japonicus TaxID=27405 RepID=UPI001C71418A|nr:uncharacterized protein LOC122242264 [Penaeus japonicus]
MAKEELLLEDSGDADDYKYDPRYPYDYGIRQGYGSRHSSLRSKKSVVFVEPEEESVASSQFWDSNPWLEEIIALVKERGPTVLVVLMLAGLGIFCTLAGWWLLAVAGALNYLGGIIVQGVVLPVVGLILLMMSVVVFRTNWASFKKEAEATSEVFDADPKILNHASRSQTLINNSINSKKPSSHMTDDMKFQRPNVDMSSDVKFQKPSSHMTDDMKFQDVKLPIRSWETDS